VALAILVGSVAGVQLPMAVGFYAVLGLAALAGALAMLPREHLRPPAIGLVLAALLCGAAIHARLNYYHLPADDVATFAGHSPHLATLRVTAVSSPVTHGGGPAAGWRRMDQTSFVARVEAIRTGDHWRAASGLTRVTVEEPAAHVAAGQELELVGWLGQVYPPTNPGQLDRSALARLSGLRTWVKVSSRDGARVLGGPTSPAGRAWWHLRAATRQHLLSVGEGQEGPLLNALIIGERHPSLGSLNASMRRLGIAHFLSISGMHLGVFLGVVWGLCRLAAAGPRRSAAIVLVVLAGYLLLAEPNGPLLRAAIMAACLCGGILLGRGYNALNSLAVAAIVLLMVDPLSAFTAGFQLSFGIVASMILLHRPMRELLFGRWLRRRGLVVFRGRSGPGRWLRYRLTNALASTASLTLAAYVVAAPLVAWHFGLVSPYAMILSVALTPLVAVVLVPAYLSAALAWPMPNLSAAVGKLAAGAAGLLEETVNLLAQLPAVSIELRPVSAWWVLVVVGSAAVVAHSYRWRRGRYIAAACLLAAAGATAWTQRTAPPPAWARLHVLAVGDGQCAILHTPSGETFFIDAGTRSGFDAWRQTVGPFLRHMRLPAPRTAFVSHGNTDHFNALIEPIESGLLRELRTTHHLGRDLPAERAEPSSQMLVEQCQARGVRVQRLAAGERIQLDERTSVEVLWPGPEATEGTNANDSSLVLRVVCDGRSVLLPGDIELTPQQQLTREGPAIASDVLILPHHGGWRRSLPAFVEAVDPDVVVQSSARMPRLNWPDPTRRDFYRQLTTTRQFLSTARNGWVCVELAPRELKVESMR
jgi:competence protein ComEC